MSNAIFCVVILALLQTILGMAVSGCRRKFKKSTGLPDDPAHIMRRIATAYSNCAEWHPLFYALLLVQPVRGGPSWAVWIPPVVVTARCLLVVGLVTFTLKKPNLFRVLGAGLTYISALLLSGLIIASFF
jgi:uncharacterized membrane protein YecN with MAPEG domain